MMSHARSDDLGNACLQLPLQHAHGVYEIREMTQKYVTRRFKMSLIVQNRIV